MVLGITMLITVIGIGALATTRVTTRATGTSADWQEAGSIAFSAVEHAIAKLNSEGEASPTTWRTPYTSGAVAFSSSYGRGRIKWVLEDSDGVFADDYVEPFKIYGIGQVGMTKRVFSTTLIPGGDGLAVLRTACHAGGGVKIDNMVTAFNGPVSANGDLTGGGTLRGSSEIAGAGGTASPAKLMPSGTVFELYKSMATVIPASAIASGSFAPPGGLTADNNPYGDKNPNGIYMMTIPDTVATLTVQSCHIKGTLLIIGATSRTDQNVNFTGAMFLEPNRPTFPTLIIKKVKKVTVDGSISQYSDATGDYPSEIRGLVHVISTPDVQLKDQTYVVGTVICDGDLQLSGSVGFSVDPRLIAQPPMGYTKGNRMYPAAGGWKWDTPPAGS